MTARGKVHAIHNPLRIRVAATAAAARRLMRGGYCPVECGFGSTSVVNRLRMDHHGPLRHLEGVAIRSYEDHFGACARRPWFAVTGYADEDVTWAIGSLAGLLPHPSRAAEFRNAPVEMRERWTADRTSLARLINRVDTDPAPLDLSGTADGRLLLAWRLRGSFPLRDSLAFYAGIDRWRSLLTLAAGDEVRQYAGLLALRLKRIRAVRHERIGKHVTLVNASIWGFAMPYAWEWHRRWKAAVLFVFQPRISGRGTVTVCARNRKVAERLYGEDGLINLFARLRPAGWGGRQLIGGSPRGRSLSWEEARAAATVAQESAGAKT